jgi:hypothetical protein
MRRYLWRSLITAWTAALTILLVRFWYARPDSFPSPLKSLGNAMIDLVGTGSAEYAADLELLYLVLIALLVVAPATWLGVMCMQRIVAGKRDPR